MSIHRSNYARQINKVIDYIYNNLNRPIAIEELSSLIELSPFHFQRVFAQEVGEPIGKFIKRRRMERAANALLNRQVAVKDVAYDWGFNSVSSFCRAFKQTFGVTPEEYRRTKGQTDSINCQFNSINDAHTSVYTRYFCREKTLKIGGKKMNCTFEIKVLPARPIIYCRHQGPFDQMQHAFAKLMQWAYPRGFVKGPENCMMSVYHDNPDITEPDKLTSDAGLFVSEEIKPDGEIGSYTVTGGRYAVGRFEIGMAEFPAAWEGMLKLIAENGCICGEGHHYEVYHNNHDEHPEKKFIVDICIPVTPK